MKTYYKNNHIKIDGLDIVEVITNNYNSRRGSPIDWIVLHSTYCNLQITINTFFSKYDKASAHFVIPRGDEHKVYINGNVYDVKSNTVFYIVPLDKRAWHAGQRGKRRKILKDPNSRSVGIEMVSHYYSGSGFEKPIGNWVGGFTDEQYKNVALLVKYLTDTYEIPIQFPQAGPHTYHQNPYELRDFTGILGHGAISYTKRNSCPGKDFDWKRLIEEVVQLSEREKNDLSRSKIGTFFDKIKKTWLSLNKISRKET